MGAPDDMVVSLSSVDCDVACDVAGVITAADYIDCLIDIN